HVAAVNHGLSGVSSFFVDSGTGALTFASAQHGGQGWAAVDTTILTPDSTFLYALSSRQNTLSWFARDALSGDLTLGGVYTSPMGAAGGLDDPRALGLSADAAHI